MFSRSLVAKNLFKQRPQVNSVLGAMTTRGAYTDETRPYVFINEHTKVICQGMTGKHVSNPATQTDGNDLDVSKHPDVKIVQIFVKESANQFSSLSFSILECLTLTFCF